MGTAVANSRFDQKMVEFKKEVRGLMPQIEAAVPEHVRPNQIIRTLFNAVQANPDILVKCTPSSIGKCLIRAATYGLEIASGQLGHCYLVPYGDEAQLQLSYKGIKELVRRSGEGMIFMGEVREGDQFEDRGQDEKPLHRKIDDPDRHKRKVTHAYAYMKFTNGFVVSRVMTRNECISHRDRYSKNWSRSKKKDNPWHEENDAFPKMCQKTCVHGLANDGDIPLSADLREALHATDAEMRPAEVVDANVVPVPQLEQGEIEQLDEDQLNTMARECDDMNQCDRLEKELQQQFPEQKQEIYEAFEARREEIARIEEQS